nr:hypothetical protein [Paenibacillus sp. J31TS4]
MRAEFVYDERLGIPVPSLSREWDDYSAAEQASILLEWEAIRGTIPDRIYRLERIIIRKQDQLDREDDFAVSCRLNSEIAELASTITDLHIWYRVQQDRTDTKSHT